MIPPRLVVTIPSMDGSSSATVSRKLTSTHRRGNGRTGRLIAILKLIDFGLLTEPLINLSPYFEVRSDQYRYLLCEVNTRCAWDEWIGFFCRAIAEQAADAEARIRALLDWRDSTLTMLRATRVKGVAIAVTEKLIEHPTVTVKNIADSHRVSAQAANNAATRLVDLGVLAELRVGTTNVCSAHPPPFGAWLLLANDEAPGR